MVRPHQSKIDVLFKASDVGLILTGYIWAFGMDAGGWRGVDSLALLLAAGGYYVAASLNDVYRSWRMAPVRRELWRVAASWVASLCLQFFAALAFGLFADVSREMLFVWAAGTGALLLAWHAFVRLSSRQLRRLGRNSRKVAFVGATDMGVELAETLNRQSWMGLNVVGFYDDRRPGASHDRTADIGDASYLGGFDDAVRAARNGKVDLVFLALPFRAERRVRELADKFSDTTAALYYANDYRALDLLAGRYFMMGDVMVVSMRESPFQGLDGFVKRLEDVVLSVLILALIAAPAALIAIGVKLSSPGPVLFKQKRYGLNGQPITVWKFRTMRVMEPDGLVQARANDPRVTPFGRFLRKTSLDELPQFVNVLSGDMSIVGPRPHAVAHNEKYRRIVKSYMVRHTVKPGVTGLAQVNGWRGETDTTEKMQQRVEYDLEYIQNWSVFLDLKIILLTVLRGFSDENAY